MFETDTFRAAIASTIARQASLLGLTEYEISAVTFLQDIARANEQELMNRELRSAPAQRRGIPDALLSVQEIAKLAGSYTVRESRSILSRADVERAYVAMFCRIWPFCK